MVTQTNFWHKRNVVITGHTGFKGAWLTFWLNRLGAQVTGISLPPTTEPNLFSLAGVDQLCESHFCDITDREKIRALIHSAKPEIIFHLAAQSLVRVSYREPAETFAINVMGTTNVLEALRGLDSTKAAIMITTDKVYQNNEWPWPYRETDALGGHDPYSASKAASEIVISSYRDAFLQQQGVAVASARAGNVIGGGDWSEDRIIPDAVKAWRNDMPLEVRRPDAVRPWQHVLEPLAGYLSLAQKLWHEPALAGSFNFGPDPHKAASVRKVIQLARASYGKGEVCYQQVRNGPHEAGTLTLEVAKAKNVLGHKPLWDIQEAVFRTMRWYLAVNQGKDPRKLCEAEIADYEQCWNDNTL